MIVIFYGFFITKFVYAHFARIPKSYESNGASDKLITVLLNDETSKSHKNDTKNKQKPNTHFTYLTRHLTAHSNSTVTLHFQNKF